MIDHDKHTSLLPDLISYDRREFYIHFASINLKEGKIILNKFFSKSFRNLKVSGIKKSFVFLLFLLQFLAPKFLFCFRLKSGSKLIIQFNNF
jgi:hypothetical protein